MKIAITNCAHYWNLISTSGSQSQHTHPSIKVLGRAAADQMITHLGKYFWSLEGEL